MKKVVVLVLLVFWAEMVWGQNASDKGVVHADHITNGLNLESFYGQIPFPKALEPPVLKKEAEMSAVFMFNPGEEINCIFLKEKVISVSDDVKNKRNFGKYVETVVEIKYNYRGQDRTDKLYVVYSNLSKVKAKKGDDNNSYNGNLILGLTGGAGTPIHKDNNLYIYIYTIGSSPYLDTISKAYTSDGNIYWWDPCRIINPNIKN
ncbi:MAG: hypothetical protein Pg6A_11700 [Termitinemataceae bacterium]|nr:MAG: hypothetical protein Pg6A_11700 [Termitinemataceae bacterium]